MKRGAIPSLLLHLHLRVSGLWRDVKEVLELDFDMVSVCRGDRDIDMFDVPGAVSIAGEDDHELNRPMLVMWKG